MKELKDTSLIADSLSTVLIKAMIGPKANPNQDIHISTNNGVLTLPGVSRNSSSTGTLTISSGYKEAIVQLHASKVPQKNVTISAKIGNFVSTASIEFKMAYPDFITVHPQTYKSTNFDPININIKALRKDGVISDGLIYWVEALAPDSILLNYNQTGKLINGNGTITLENISQKKGQAQIIISVPNSDNTVLKKTCDIIFQYN